MKEFSPAGMATKGFYGGVGWNLGGDPVGGGRGGQSGAKTFGNPDGAQSGGGAYGAGGANANGPHQGGGGGAPALWTEVYTGAAGDSITNLVVVTATNIVGTTFFTPHNVVYSNDAGATWTLVVNPLPTFTTLQSLATDGSVVCVMGTDAGSNAVVGRSTDGGATWAPVVVGAGFTGIEPIAYAGGHFVIFDQAVAQVWRSSDGLTWSAVALTQIFLPGNWQRVDDAFVVAQGRGVWVGQNNFHTTGRAVTTNDGVTFTQTTLAARVAESVSYDGVFNAIGPQGGGPIYDMTSPDGGVTAWTLANNSGPPPFEALQTALPGIGILNTAGFGPLQVATSTDHGVTYSTVTPTTALTQFYELGNDGARLFIYGDGIIATTNLVTYTDELVVAGGLVRSGAAGFGLSFAFGADAAGAAIWKRANQTKTLNAFNVGGVGSTGPSSNGPGQTQYSLVSSAFAGTPSGFGAPGFTPDPFTINGVLLVAFGQISTSPVNIPPNGLGFIVILNQAGLPQNHFAGVSFTLGDGASYSLSTASAMFNAPWNDTATGGGYTTWVWVSNEPFFPPADFAGQITVYL